MSGYALAPAAPGSMGADVAAHELLEYLDLLGRWRDQRRAELDQLDEAALRAPAGSDLTGDIILSMALWKSIADRYDLLVSTWDSGRVAEAGRRRMTTLIWGRLDAAAGADGPAPGSLALSLPEACRLSDTLAASLRSALGIGGTEPDAAGRVQALRAGVERVRDQVQLIPVDNRSSAAQVLIDLDRRVVDVTERLRRGAEVGGLLGPLESALATAERDLIVAAAKRAKARNDHARAQQLRSELAARGEEVRALAAAARAQVRPVPRMGIPDVSALGEVPAGGSELDSYLARLERAGAALDQVRAAFAAALDRRGELTGLARSYAAGVSPGPAADVPGAADDLAAMLELVSQADAAEPVDTDRLAALAAAIQAYTGSLRKAGTR